MPKVKYSAKALIVSSQDPDLMLLVRERLTNGDEIYDLPGGKMEVGETEAETVQREVHEELGVEVRVGQKLGQYWFMDERLNVKVICHTFLCTLKSDQEFDLDNNPAQHEDIFGVEWIKTKEVLAANFSGLVPSLRELIKKV